jgi:hypothetical protein
MRRPTIRGMTSRALAPSFLLGTDVLAAGVSLLALGQRLGVGGGWHIGGVDGWHPSLLAAVAAYYGITALLLLYQRRAGLWLAGFAGAAGVVAASLGAPRVNVVASVLVVVAALWPSARAEFARPLRAPRHGDAALVGQTPAA